MRKIIQYLKYTILSCKDAFFKKDASLYVFLVILISFIIFGSIPMRGKMYMYIDIGADTYSSYWPKYVFAKSYFSSFSLSGWTFQSGLGNNIFVLHPSLFDPYNAILLPFSKENLDTGIFIATLAKVFSLAGLAFQYLKSLGFKKEPLIISSLAYTFSGFFIGWGQHYQVATGFVLFTFVLLSLEIWIKTTKRTYLILSVFLLAVNSPYRLFMSLVFLGIYYMFRYFNLFGFKLRTFVYHGLQTLILVIGGVLLAGVLFFPNSYVLFQSPRVSGQIIPRFYFASLEEYISIFTRFFSNGLLGGHFYHGYSNYYESPFLYIGILAIFIIPRNLVLKPHKKSFFVIFFLIVLALLFPSFSNPIFGALSSYTYRWTFILVPVFAVALAHGLSIDDNGCCKWTYFLSVTLGIVAAALGWSVRPSQDLFANYLIHYLNPLFSIVTVFIFSLLYGYFFIFRKSRWRNYSSLLLIFFVFEITITGFVTVNFRSLVNASDKYETPYFDVSTNSVLEHIKRNDQSFYRINKQYDENDLTDALFQDFFGEKQYSSVITSNIWNLQDLFNLRGVSSNYLFGFDGAQPLRDAASVKYMLSHNAHDYAGYEFLYQEGDVYVYENKNAFPLGTVYYKDISLSNFEKLSVFEKKNILYQAVVLPDNFSHQLGSFSFPIMDNRSLIPTSIQNGHKEVVTGAKVSLDPSASSLFVDILEPTKNSLVLSFFMNSMTKKTGRLYLRTEDVDFNKDDSILFDVRKGRHEYSLTLPIRGITGIRIDFSNIENDVVVEDLTVFSRNDDKIREEVNNLTSSDVLIESFTGDYVRADVHLTDRGMLYFSIPFDEGWHVYVDGKEAKKNLANIAFLGVFLDKGQHIVELKYIPPGFREGAQLSALILLLAVSFQLVRIFFMKKKGGG